MSPRKASNENRCGHSDCFTCPWPDCMEEDIVALRKYHQNAAEINRKNKQRRLERKEAQKRREIS